MKSIITFVAVFTAMLFICLNLSGDSIDFIHITLEKSKAGASSTLAEKDKPAWYYGSDKAFDGLSETAWCEGKKDDGTGEYIYSEFEPFKTWGFTILNGFGGYRHLYFKNNRVKDFKLTLYTADGKIRIIKDKCKDDACGQALAGGKLTPEDFCQEEVPDYEKNKNNLFSGLPYYI